jgi:WD repeat and SOF domain-containing protein 1
MTSPYAVVPRERHKGHAGRLTISNILPRFSSPSGAEREKYASYAAKTPWITVVPIPLRQTYRMRLYCINPRKLCALAITRFGRRRASLLLCLLFISLIVLVKVLLFREERPTLVFRREDLQRIWHWEVSSGHFPSRQGSESRILVPEEMQLRISIENPALPPQLVSNYPSEIYATITQGTGARRSYIDLRSAPANAGFPPRPVPGSIIDFDIVMQHCAFERNKVFLKSDSSVWVQP